MVHSTPLYSHESQESKKSQTAPRFQFAYWFYESYCMGHDAEGNKWMMIKTCISRDNAIRVRGRWKMIACSSHTAWHQSHVIHNDKGRHTPAIGYFYCSFSSRAGVKYVREPCARAKCITIATSVTISAPSSVQPVAFSNGWCHRMRTPSTIFFFFFFVWPSNRQWSDGKKKWPTQRQACDSLWFLLTRAICPSYRARCSWCRIYTYALCIISSVNAESSWNLCSTHGVTPQSTRRQWVCVVGMRGTDADFRPIML